MRPYRAPRWLRGGHAQTIYPVLLRSAAPPYRRERWDTPDGDFIDLDWIEPRPGAPLVVLFHGLEGNSSSHYAVALMHALGSRRWNGVVAHFRGCSGEPNRTARAYHSGDHEEIAWILGRLRECHPGELHAVGVSLGGSALLNWLGRHGEAAGRVVTRAAAVCAPVDLTACGHALGRGFNRVYGEHFLRTLRRTARVKLDRFPGLYDAAAVAACRSLYRFDTLVTAPLHGFKDADDYWLRASSRPWLERIRVPTLVLNALNDPFVPRASLAAPGEVSPAVALEYPAEGGHVGFVDGPFPGRLDWLPRRLIDFFSQIP